MKLSSLLLYKVNNELSNKPCSCKAEKEGIWFERSSVLSLDMEWFSLFWEGVGVFLTVFVQPFIDCHKRKSSFNV